MECFVWALEARGRKVLSGLSSHYPGTLVLLRLIHHARCTVLSGRSGCFKDVCSAPASLGAVPGVARRCSIARWVRARALKCGPVGALGACVPWKRRLPRNTHWRQASDTWLRQHTQRLQRQPVCACSRQRCSRSPRRHSQHRCAQPARARGGGGRQRRELCLRARALALQLLQPRRPPLPAASARPVCRCASGCPVDAACPCSRAPRAGGCADTGADSGRACLS